MENDRKVFKCVVNGIEQEFEILYTFKSLKTKKDYLIQDTDMYQKIHMQKM